MAFLPPIFFTLPRWILLLLLLVSVLAPAYADSDIPSSPPIPLNGHKWPKQLLGIKIEQSCVDMRLTETSFTMPEIIWRGAKAWYDAFSYFNYTNGTDIRFICKPLPSSVGLAQWQSNTGPVTITIATTMKYAFFHQLLGTVNHEIGHAHGLDHAPANMECDLMAQQNQLGQMGIDCRSVLPTLADVQSLMYLYQTPIPEFGGPFMFVPVAFAIVCVLVVGRRMRRPAGQPRVRTIA